MDISPVPAAAEVVATAGAQGPAAAPAQIAARLAGAGPGAAEEMVELELAMQQKALKAEQSTIDIVA